SYIFPGSTTFNYLNHGGARFVPEAAGESSDAGGVVDFLRWRDCCDRSGGDATAALAPQRPRPRGRGGRTGGISQAVSAAPAARGEGCVVEGARQPVLLIAAPACVAVYLSTRWLNPKREWNLRRLFGAHQFHLPSSVMVAGTSSMRTRVA